MVKSNRKNAYQEAYTILQELNEEEYSKIPPEVIQALKENRNEEYNYEVDEDQEAKISANVTRNKSNIIQYIQRLSSNTRAKRKY